MKQNDFFFNKLGDFMRAKLYPKDGTNDFLKLTCKELKNLQRTKNSLCFRNEKTRDDSNSNPKQPRSHKHCSS